MQGTQRAFMILLIVLSRFKVKYKGHYVELTSRERHQSAPYPRLKNSQKTFKCQVFFYSTRRSKIFRNFFLKKLHTKKMDRVARHNAEKLKGGTL